MTARTHDAIAFASLVTIATIIQPDSLNVATLIVSIIAADIGALIPDMDGGGNRLWHMLPAGENMGKILRRIFYKHRTLSHSFIGMFIVFKFLEWVLYKLLNPAFLDPQIVLASVMIGYISHLVADGLTEEGVPLLFPININFGIPPIRKMRIKTGKWFENFVVYPSIWIYLLWFINANQNKLIAIFDKF